MIKGRTAHDPRPCGKAPAVNWRAELVGMFTLAPMAHHLRQRDLDRADALAASAERRGVWQVSGLCDANQARRQYSPHRTRIDPSIGMAANCGIDRTMVHAGRTADASQHLLKLGPNHRAAAIVEKHHVVLLGPIQISRSA